MHQATPTSSTLVGKVQGFFAYHGIWAPGVRLFRALSFRTKSVIMTSCFVVPILALAYSYYTDKASLIAFSEKEREGVAYGQAVLNLLTELQQARAKAAEPNNHAAAWKALAEVQTTAGDTLGTAAMFTATASAMQQADPGAQVQAALDLLGTSTDGSNLTLDPDIDSYYLMDAVYFRLPFLADAVAQIQAMALRAAAGTPNVRGLIEQRTLAKAHLQALNSGLNKAVATNARLKQTVQAEAALQALSAYLAQAESALDRPSELAPLASSAPATLAAVAALAARANQQLDALLAERISTMKQSRGWTTLVLALGLSAAIYLLVCFRKVLAGGMKVVAGYIDAMRAGNLTTAPPPRGADEVAWLMRSLAEMQNALRGIINNVRASSEAIAANTQAIAGDTAAMSGHAETTATSLRSSADTLGSVAGTVAETASAATRAASHAADNAQAAQRGGTVIGEMLHTMGEIESSSRRIGEIIGTIDGIAFQTTILALNAAVEAARAGEQGRGFAVVAAEVRQLALRSSTAAREIRTLVADNGARIAEGSRVAGEAGRTMADIVQSTQSVDELLGAIADRARSQAEGVHQTTAAIMELDKSTQANVDRATRSAQAAGALRSNADQLVASVATFVLTKTPAL